VPTGLFSDPLNSATYVYDVERKLGRTWRRPIPASKGELAPYHFDPERPATYRYEYIWLSEALHISRVLFYVRWIELLAVP